MGAKQTTLKIDFLFIYRNAEIIGNTHVIPLHNDPSPMKTVGGVGFEITENVTFQERVFDNMYYIKINNYTSRTNRRHESVHGYCLDIQVMYLNIQVNTVITLPRRN